MSVDEDAHVFGQHFLGGWQLGLLVARNVHKQAAAGRPPKSEPVRNKVSCAKFAKLAGVSERTVQLVYDTWQLAAEEGHCTPAGELSPGDEDLKLSGTDVGDQEHREMWRKFHRQTRERNAGKRKGQKGSGRRQGENSRSQSQANAQAGDTDRETPSTEAHPLYELLLAINHLGDILKRGGSAASIFPAAEKVATAQHKAALRRAMDLR